MIRLLIIIACAVGLNVNAQEKPFRIDGEVKGADVFKYVYAFDNEYKLIQRSEIKEGRFLLNGTYNPVHKFGEPAFSIVVLSNEDNSDAVVSDGSLSNRKHHNCRVMLEEKISLQYNTDTRSFLLDGGAPNKVQNKFVKVNTSYRNRRDSAYASLDKINTNDEAAKVAEAKRLFKEAVDQMIKLIGENSDSEASLINIMPVIINQLTSAAEVEETFNRLSDRLKSSEYGINIKRDVDDRIRMERTSGNPPYTVGMKFPDFELMDNQDKMIKSINSFSKYTLIDFWATWCGPCRQETPNLIVANSKFKEKGFKVITISIDENSAQKKWLEVIESDKMSTFINLFNGNDRSGLAKELKIVAIPTNFLVDSTGRIIAMNLRGSELQNKLKELMP